MALTFTTTDKATTNHGIKMLVYGAAGTGKTTFCGTAPSPIIISAESGLMSLRHQKIPAIEVKEMQDVWDSLTWCQQNAAKFQIKTICLDSISEIGERCLVRQKKATKDPRQAYGGMADELIEVVKAFRDLPGFNVIVTAKQTTGKDPVTGVERAAPTAPGQQVGPALPYLFDLVMHAFTDRTPQGQTYHALRTHAAFNADAKDRSGVLDELEYPDASNIITKILTPR